jgi:CheY-like chemotaxis protein
MPFNPNQQKQFVILIANCNEINRSLLKHQLEHSWHYVILAKEQNEFSTLIKTVQFDLIVFDWNVNGLKLINLISGSECINNKTPVIAIGNTTDNIHQGTAGIDDYIVSPMSAIKLNEIIGLWQIKNKTTDALDYIQMILNKTKNNRSLTLTIFKKLFEELPLQIIIIKKALENGHYALAEETTHKLHGSVSFCGLIDIQNHAYALESCLINRNYKATHPNFLLLQQRILNLTCHQRIIMDVLNQDESIQ